MHLKGLDTLRQHVPALSTTWGFLPATLAMAAVIALTCLFFLAADTYFPEWMPDGEIIILALGFLVLSRFFSQRARMQERYGDSAYAKAYAHYAIPGLGMIVASIAHLGYIAGPLLPDLWWVQWLRVLGYILVAEGVVLSLRTATSAGFDYMLMLYVYQPAESRRFDVPIYSLLRHPIYSAAIDLGFGLALIHHSWYALLVAVLLPLFFLGWVRLVEEPELLTRFPDYAEYRKQVPPFWPRLRNVLKFWQFLLTGRT